MYQLVFKFNLLEVSQLLLFTLLHTHCLGKSILYQGWSAMLLEYCVLFITTLNLERLVHWKCHRHGLPGKRISWGACAKIYLIHNKFDFGACDQIFSPSGANLECATINSHSLIFHLSISSKKIIQVIANIVSTWRDIQFIPHFKRLKLISIF